MPAHLLAWLLAHPVILAPLIFCLAATAGQVAHGVNTWANKETETILGWFTGDRRHTIAALMGNAATMIGFIQTVNLAAIYAADNGWWALLVFGFGQGWFVDSALNKRRQQPIDTSAAASS